MSSPVTFGAAPAGLGYNPYGAAEEGQQEQQEEDGQKEVGSGAVLFAYRVPCRQVVFE